MDKRDIRDAYDRVAPWFDVAEAPLDLLGLRSQRRRLLRHARGRVLEAAVGTGRNLPHYPGGCAVTGVDLSGGMLSRAGDRARRLGLPVRLCRMDTERLAFRDDAFDTVVDSLTLCTYPHPVAALREMARVCRPGGRILLLEHGRSSHGWLARFQDRHDDWLYRAAGCRWNREPLELVREAGLEVEAAHRSFLGIFHRIRVRPGGGADTDPRRRHYAVAGRGGGDPGEGSPDGAGEQ